MGDEKAVKLCKIYFESGATLEVTYIEVDSDAHIYRFYNHMGVVTLTVQRTRIEFIEWLGVK